MHTSEASFVYTNVHQGKRKKEVLLTPSGENDVLDMRQYISEEKLNNLSASQGTPSSDSQLNLEIEEDTYLYSSNSLESQLMTYRTIQNDAFNKLQLQNECKSVEKGTKLSSEVQIEELNNNRNFQQQQFRDLHNNKSNHTMNSQGLYRSKYNNYRATHQQFRRPIKRIKQETYSQKNSRDKFTNNKVIYQQRRHLRGQTDSPNREIHSQAFFFREQSANHQSSSWQNYLAFVRHIMRS